MRKDRYTLKDQKNKAHFRTGVARVWSLKVLALEDTRVMVLLMSWSTEEEVVF